MSDPPSVTAPGLQAPTPRLVLASRSSARLQLLEAAGLSVSTWPADLDEAAVKRRARDEGQPAGAAALLLAGAKAEAACAPDALVIGADQILACAGRWLDKPPDLAAARAHLRFLRGRTHVLHTAVSCRRQGRVVWQHVAASRLRMRALSDDFIERYLLLEGERILACVGAYRLEGPGLQLFDAVQGEQAAILGLPMLPLLAFLRTCGVLPA